MIKQIKKRFFLLLLVLLLLTIFKNWFTFNPLSSGDWNFRFDDQIGNFTLFPYVWSPLLSSTGGNISFILGLNTYFLSTALILSTYFHIQWLLIERLVWFWPFLIISIFSSHFLFKKLFPNKFALLSSFIFLFNTYNLMLVGGGQMGVAMAYAASPLVLAFFIKLIDGPRLFFRTSVIAGFIVALQFLFDIRISYVMLFAAFIYFFISGQKERGVKNFIKKFGKIFIPTGLITILLNAFWLLPFLAYHQNPLQQLGEAYSTAGAVGYFSFAKFEQTISLLHPYWTENIFGKVGFMKSEFLILPILAYTGLFFINGLKSLREKRYILFFSLLGLLGAFLAKGANSLFGEVYLWLFSYFPGFIMFRDPTKWYLLVVISYSILIPFTVWKIHEWLRLKSKFSIFNFQNVFLLFVISCLLFLIRPAWMGDLTGTFKSHNLPNDYIKLEQFLSKDKYFYRTFWVPAYERFGFRSDVRSAISGKNFINKYDPYDTVDYLRNKNSQEILQELSVRYVIVPFDSQGEIFLKDRKYDDKQYLDIVKNLKSIPWLKEVRGFGKIGVFEVSSPKDHFWSTKENLVKSYKHVNPTKYEIEVQNAKKGDVLVFSESYDFNWVAKNNDFKNLNSKPYNKLFNSFVLEEDGNYSLQVYYSLQTFVNIGLIISVITLIVIVSIFVCGHKSKKMAK